MPTAHSVDHGQLALHMFAATLLACRWLIGIFHRADGFEFVFAIKADVFVDGHKASTESEVSRLRGFTQRQETLDSFVLLIQFARRILHLL